MVTEKKKDTQPPEGAAVAFVPTEEQILKELKQREQRKKYMTSDKSKGARKAYMKKRYDEAKAMRDYMNNNPELVEKIKTEHNIP